jgi:hypothetical protein
MRRFTSDGPSSAILGLEQQNAERIEAVKDNKVNDFYLNPHSKVLFKLCCVDKIFPLEISCAGSRGFYEIFISALHATPDLIHSEYRLVRESMVIHGVEEGVKWLFFQAFSRSESLTLRISFHFSGQVAKLPKDNSDQERAFKEMLIKYGLINANGQRIVSAEEEEESDLWRILKAGADPEVTLLRIKKLMSVRRSKLVERCGKDLVAINRSNVGILPKVRIDLINKQAYERAVRIDQVLERKFQIDTKNYQDAKYAADKQYYTRLSVIQLLPGHSDEK